MRTPQRISLYIHPSADDYAGWPYGIAAGDANVSPTRGAAISSVDGEMRGLMCNAAQTPTRLGVTLEVRVIPQESSMHGTRVFLIAVAVIVSAHVGSAQELSRYRVYTLESDLASVVAASGVRLTDVKTLHERPARIQELEWRAPYVSSGSDNADPVRGIAFGFYNDALYQIVVTYDHGRTDGLTSSDVIKSLSEGTANPSSVRGRAARPAWLRTRSCSRNGTAPPRR